MKIQISALFIGAVFFCAVVRGQNASGPAFALPSLQNGALELKLNATAGKSYVIEASVDLKNWFPLYTTNAAAGTISVLDSSVSGLSQQFYRALQYDGPINNQTNTATGNDNFANRVTLSGVQVIASGSNVNATHEAGEPEHVYFDTGEKSVWWSWVAPANGTVTISTAGTYFDTLIAVYTGSSLAQLSTVAKNRYLSQFITFEAKQGTAYQIAVDGNQGASGTIALQLALSPFSTGIAPLSIADTQIALNETSDPNVPRRIIRIAVDGKTWSEVQNGSTNITDSGAVLSYLGTGGAATLQLQGRHNGQTNALGYQFIFSTGTTGKYSWTVDGQAQGEGKFSNFRTLAGNFAPTSVGLLRFLMTQSTGQTHSYTFFSDGRFQDSDGQDQSSGVYTYNANGASATLSLHYQGPDLYVGDQQQITLQFDSITTGTFQSNYTLNDGGTSVFDGAFLLEY